MVNTDGANQGIHVLTAENRWIIEVYRRGRTGPLCITRQGFENRIAAVVTVRVRIRSVDLPGPEVVRRQNPLETSGHVKVVN